MARLARAVFPGHPHHVTQRGNGCAQTFFCDADYALYRDLLGEHCAAAGVEIWAWVLMPNHVHLILVPGDPDGLRRALAVVHRRYAGHVHARLKRSGHFWQGRFGCVAMDEAHLGAALRYVALNPVRAGMTARATDWPWSSVHAHLGAVDDGLTTTAPVLERYPDFAALLAAGEEEEAFTRLRKAESVGRPVGDAGFLEALEVGSGRSLAPARRGRKAAKSALSPNNPGSVNTGRFQYTGQAWLDELGMYYYKARLYSPTLGRFLQTDPIGYRDQTNLYAYVGNDPTNGADPSGLCTGSRITEASGDCSGGGHVSGGSAGGCSGDCRPSAVPTTKAERADIAKGTEAGVNDYWESRCKRGDPIGCVAPNFKSDGTASGVAVFSRSSLLQGIMNQHIVGHEWQATPDGPILNPIYDMAAVNAEYLSIRWDLAWSNMWWVDHDRSGTRGLLSANQIAQYHWDVFAKYGLPRSTYGGTFFSGRRGEIPLWTGLYCNSGGGHCDAR